MLRKCSICDVGKEPSINTKVNKYVYDKSKYYHYDCYVNRLVTKKKLTKEQAIIEAERIISLHLDSEKEKNAKDDFFQLIKDRYEQEYTSYFFQKVNRMNNGTFRKEVSYCISYQEFLEMYSNEKMRIRLDQIAHKSNISNDERLDWDLGVMFNEYPKYLKAKRRSIKDSDSAKRAIEDMNRYRINPSERYKEARELAKTKNSDSVNIEDIINDMLE